MAEQAAAPFEVTWDAGAALLTTRVRSPITVDEVALYKEALDGVLAAIPSGTTFAWMSSAVDYDAFSDRAAHAAMRAIVPSALAAHGLRTSMLDLYEGADVPIARTRGVSCGAIAHVHGDAQKMEALDSRFGGPAERYFGDEKAALEWVVRARSPEDV
ncbi:MAG TPA: hypothetical protein VGM06_00985 [Polyangiaceae bacterium]|jgi:hypothetical protein